MVTVGEVITQLGILAVYVAVMPLLLHYVGTDLFGWMWVKVWWLVLIGIAGWLATPGWGRDIWNWEI